MREEQKQAVGVPAPAAPKDNTAPWRPDAAAVQPVFVAPPRTIADITAILDSEKPDDAKIAARKAAADATPPANASAFKLAQFYYDRGNARALLARNKDALADGLQALASPMAVIEFKQVARIRQFVVCNTKRSAIRNKRLQSPRRIVRDADSTRPPRQPDQLHCRISLRRRWFPWATSVRPMLTRAVSNSASRRRAAVQIPNGVRLQLYGRSWESPTPTQRARTRCSRRAANTRSRGSLPSRGSVSPRSVEGPASIRISAASGTVDAGSRCPLLAVARNESKEGAERSRGGRAPALLEILKAQGKYSPATP
jgi:hypothetical protein